MRTWDEIAAKINATEKEAVAWENDDQTPMVEYEMREVRAVSARLDRCWSELYDFVSGPEIEPLAYRLVMALDAWIDEVDRFRDDHKANPGGTDDVWRAWKECVTLASRKPQPLMLETIEYLTRVQKCSPSQIAKIYEWKDEFGQPDARRVLADLEAGKGKDPVVSPHWTRQVKADAELWEARSSRVQQKITEPVKRVPSEPVIAPESLDMLLHQNVPSRQIARMKNLDQQTVIDYARENGLLVDGQVPPPAVTPELHLQRVRTAANEKLAAAKEYAEDPGSAAAKVDSYPDLNNYREQVRQMAFDGCSKQQIVAGLKEQYPDRAKPGSVAQIMAAIEREAAAE